MQISFYDASVVCYQQMLESTANLMDKGQQHAEANGMALEEITDYRLHETMLPFSFQIISVWHHSYGAVRGMREGLFMPPPDKPGIDYAGLRGLVDEALSAMTSETEESMAALSGQKMLFRFGNNEVPFTTDNFLTTFSKPNVYFHVTTAYAMLRQLGVPLGKLDYLGNMKVAEASGADAYPESERQKRMDSGRDTRLV